MDNQRAGQGELGSLEFSLTIADPSLKDLCVRAQVSPME